MCQISRTKRESLGKYVLQIIQSFEKSLPVLRCVGKRDMCYGCVKQVITSCVMFVESAGGSKHYSLVNVFENEYAKIVHTQYADISSFRHTLEAWKVHLQRCMLQKDIINLDANPSRRRESFCRKGHLVAKK